MEYSITFNSETCSSIIKYINKYAINYCEDLRHFISDGFAMTRKAIRMDNEELKYDLNMQIPYGEHKIKYNDIVIVLKYIKEHNVVGTADAAVKYEKLILGSLNKEILMEFIENARKNNKYIDKQDKILIRILKNGGWTNLNSMYKRGIDTLFLDIDVKEIVDNIKDFLKEEEEYRENGVPFKLTYLLHGIPGGGKTSLIYIIASALDYDICFLNITGDLDDNSFIKAVHGVPNNSILVIEDIDALFFEREGKSAVSFSALLNVLDGLGKKNKLITFLTTNHKEKLDNALVRRGRIDVDIKFNYIKEAQFIKMYTYFYPHQLEHKNMIWETIKNKKISTSEIHKFLFNNRKRKSIIDNIEDLEEIINEKKDSYSNLYL